MIQRVGAWAGCGPAESPPRCTKCNSPPINGQCNNFVLFDVALWLLLHCEGLTGYNYVFPVMSIVLNCIVLFSEICNYNNNVALVCDIALPTKVCLYNTLVFFQLCCTHLNAVFPSRSFSCLDALDQWYLHHILNFPGMAKSQWWRSISTLTSQSYQDCTSYKRLIMLRHVSKLCQTWLTTVWDDLRQLILSLDDVPDLSSSRAV